MLRVAIFLVFTLALCSTGQTADDFTIGKLLTLYNSANPQQKEFLKRDFDTLGDGIGWANVELINRGQPPLYCEPKGSSLGKSRGQYLSTFLNYVEVANKRSSKGLLSEPIGIKGYLLLQALIEAFPCKK